jgi:hypothetical protein
VRALGGGALHVAGVLRGAATGEGGRRFLSRPRAGRCSFAAVRAVLQAGADHPTKPSHAGPVRVADVRASRLQSKLGAPCRCRGATSPRGGG